MSGPGDFSADWLALREPYDRAARETDALAAETARWLGGWRDRRPADAPLEVVDLGCGTGANFRHWASRLGGRQHWQVIDHDDALLAAWPATLERWAATRGHVIERHGDALHVGGSRFQAVIRRRRLDLAADLEAVAWEGSALVTASALLDLVSAEWLQRLLDRCVAAQAAVAFALNVDGRLRWETAVEDDALLERLYAQHQRRDKGFGPALGAEAPSRAARLLAQAGYAVRQARTDWRVNRGVLLQALVNGMADAAAEQDPASQMALDAWRGERLALSRGAALEVGHIDLMAHPAPG